MPEENENAYVPQEVTSILGVIDTHLRWKSLSRANDRSYLRYHPSEWGKAQPLDAMVQTPYYGPVRMRDIGVGSEICDPFGRISKVVDIIPQGKKQIYKVVFADGDSTKCCGDHLWEVDSQQLGYVKPKVLTTEYLANNLHAPNGANYFTVRMPLPLKMYREAPRNLIHPYVLGVLIGDGCFRCNSIDFTNLDGEIVRRVSSLLRDDYQVRSRSNVQHRILLKQARPHPTGSKRNFYKNILRELGLAKVKSDERFIPEQYLFVREEDRWEILRGLMDTDGTIDKRGYAEFDTTSKKLASQFKWLIESIGGLCKVREKPTPKKLSYRCDISILDSSKLFYLTRKKQRGIIREQRVIRIISDIQKVGKKEAQCIAVDNNDGLYLTDHCIVTHNCLRKQQYKHFVSLGYIKAEPTSLTSKQTRLFDKGHNMHERWQEWYFADAGILRGLWQCPKCDEILGREDKLGIFEPKECMQCAYKGKFKYEELKVCSEEMNMTGHVDAILDFSRFNPDKYKDVRCSFNVNDLPKTPIVVDMKTINDNQWKRKIMKYGVHKEYIIQIIIYTHLLGVESGLVVYENKNDSSVAGFKVDRNDQMFETIKWQSKMMQALAKQKLLPPPRPEDKSVYECKDCEFSITCHKSSIWDDMTILEEKRKKFYRELL